MSKTCDNCNSTLQENFRGRYEEHDPDRGLIYQQRDYKCKKCDTTINDSTYGVKIFLSFRGNVERTTNWIDNLLAQGIPIEGRS
jgi:hypothetical protein